MDHDEWKPSQLRSRANKARANREYAAEFMTLYIYLRRTRSTSMCCGRSESISMARKKRNMKSFLTGVWTYDVSVGPLAVFEYWIVANTTLKSDSFNDSSGQFVFTAS